MQGPSWSGAGREAPRAHCGRTILAGPVRFLVSIVREPGDFTNGYPKTGRMARSSRRVFQLRL
jgi:hypothetical protein